MRAVFQEQPEVGHVYLGQQAPCPRADLRRRERALLAQREAPGDRPDRAGGVRPLPRKRFEDTEKGIDDEALERVLEATSGHPYGTQELAYFLWEVVPDGPLRTHRDVEAALEQASRSEHNHFAKLWDDAPHAQRLVMLALADEPTRSLYAADYAERHELPAKPALQRAIGALVTKEIVAARREPRLPDRGAVLRRLAPHRAGPSPEPPV